MLNGRMRKICLSTMLCVSVVFAAISAQAIEWKARGAWEVTTYGGDSTFGLKDSYEDQFQAYQRFRVRIDAIASENLQGTLVFKLTSQWGTAAGPNRNKDIGGALGADGTGLMLRQANITWTPPKTNLTLRMGLQSFVLPAFFVSGSPMFDGMVAGIVGNYKINDNFGITAFWLRPENDNSVLDANNPDEPEGYLDNWDMFGLTLPIKGDGFAITPWFSYSMIGKNTRHLAGGNGLYGGFFNGYYFRPEVLANTGAFYQSKGASYETFIMAGIASKWSFGDAWNATLDFHYGNVSGKYEEELNRDGWTLAGSLDYKFDWGVLGLMGWYSSGDDGDIKNGSERMPMANPDWRVSSFGYSGGTLPNGAPGSHIFDYTPAGVWSLGAYLKNVSFIEKVSHTVRVLYGRGTNDPDMAKYMVGTKAVPGGVASTLGRRGPAGDGLPLYMTTEDYFVELNLDTTWKVYDNFDVLLEIGYIYLHAGESWDLDSWNSNALRIGTSFVYRF